MHKYQLTTVVDQPMHQTAKGALHGSDVVRSHHEHRIGKVTFAVADGVFKEITVVAVR